MMNSLRVILSLFMVFSLYKSYRFQGYTDFDVYYQYGLKVLAYWKGQEPSFLVELNNTSPFRYAPLIGALIAPLCLLPHELARTLWVLVGWVCYFVSVEKLKTYFKLNTLEYFIIILGTFRFARDNASIGQISTIVLFLFTIVILNFAQKKSAISLAVSTIIKVQPIGLILIPFFQKKLNYIFVFLISILSLIAASWVLVGNDAIITWFKLFQNAHNILAPSTIGNQSLYGALFRHTLIAKSLLIVFVGIAGIITLIYWKKQKWNPLWGFSVATAFLPIFAILTWKNTYVLWLIPFAFFIKHHSWKTVLPVAILFQLLSQGMLGKDLNALSLSYGFLPITAFISILFWIVYNPKSATKAKVLINK